MRILVTGGAGFIASHIVDRYVNLGHQVFIVDNLSSGKKEYINPKAKFFKIDIQSEKIVSIIKQLKPQIINHHAAQIDLRRSVKEPLIDAQINILGLINLMEAVLKAKSVRKTIFASTGGAIYGDAETVPTSENYPAWPISPYGIAKLTSEHYLHYYQMAHDIPSVSLRYGNVYGPRQNPHGEAGVIAIFSHKMLEGQIPTINGDGKQTRDFVYVEDVVRANELVLNSKSVGIFNIATGKETNINSIFEKLARIINPKIKAKYGVAKKGEQLRSALDCKRALKELNWKPDFDLDTGLRNTVDFFRKQ